MTIASQPVEKLELRVRGRVQGVGFRPTVWRIARELGLAGEVFNDSEGVLLRVGGERSRVAALLDRLNRRLPRLARVDDIESRPYEGELPREFCIAQSAGGAAHTQVAPDAAICPACIEELNDPRGRRYRYAFTNCTQCGPRLSIVTAIPYDRASTTMAPFALCEACRAEYGDPGDRRFHAEPIACPACGPTAVLVAFATVLPGRNPGDDDIRAAARLILSGEIVAVKGLGGYHLACDARNADAIARLRRLKRREAKPFALMARDLDVIRGYCTLDPEEERQLTGVQAPIVLLRATHPNLLPQSLAPGLNTLGFMLPSTPLHHLLLQEADGPLVMTSGNASEEPTIIDDCEARQRLAGIAAYALVHDREIANRLDDSVVRVMSGKGRVLRRARGFAPAPIDLPPGFETAPEILAMGGELKATFCLLKDGQAIVSQHHGDLENAASFDHYCRSISLYRELFDHSPELLAIDRHPEYLSSKLGRTQASERGLCVVEVQHHHAHVAACLAENGYPLHASAVLGIVLDGTGFGDDETIWGGEFLLADYLGYERLAQLKPVAMAGGAQAVREPWRNLYTHLVAAVGWQALSARFSGLELHAYLTSKPRMLLDAMIAKGVNSPQASSCGRLFDAVAAAVGVCRERQAYEGEAAARLEALAETAVSSNDADGLGYRLDVTPLRGDGLLQLDPTPVWKAILRDLELGLPGSRIAMRFHHGLVETIVETTRRLAGSAHGKARFQCVALSGGCFQNRILFERIAAQLRGAGFTVLTHSELPANDGGLSLGQAAVAAARLIAASTKEVKIPCVSASPAAS